MPRRDSHLKGPLLAGLAFLILSSRAVSAQESNTVPIPNNDDSVRAEYRLRGVEVSEFPLNASGEKTGQGSYAEHRLRIGALIVEGPVSINAEADVANGLLFGDTSTHFPFVGYRRDSFGGLADPSTLLLRTLSLEAKTPIGVLRAGHMTSKWGLGLVANDGAGTPDWGDHYYGDLVERLVAATRPLARSSPGLAPLVAAIGGDIVYRDQTADLAKHDRAYQGIASLVWAPEFSSNRFGFYGVRRSQVDRDGFNLAVWMLDAHGRLQTELGPATLRLEGELARVWGETNTVRDIYDRSRAIDQVGGAVELGAGLLGERGDRPLQVVLQGGYASGDDRPHDGRLTSFKFDPEYNVGFILFDEVLALQTAAAARAVSDPLVFGRPAAGARFLPTEGSVTNAHYLMPTIKYAPIHALQLRGAVLLAQADRPLDDAYQTNAVYGGVRHTAYGSATTSLDLGVEVDLGARYTWEGTPNLAVDLQAGRFLPGDAFRDNDGGDMDPVDRVLAGLTLSW